MPNGCYDAAMAVTAAGKRDRVPPATQKQRLKTILSRLYGDDRKLQWAILVFLIVFYGALLLCAWGEAARHFPLRLLFNNMLDHLMHGRFDMDFRFVEEEEGFYRNGHYYAYFGIWCALLRLPLWMIRRMDVDLTLCSVLVATCIAGMAKVRTVLLIRRHGIRNRMTEWAVGMMLIYSVLGGCGIGNLNASLYEEVILWAYAFASIFVYLAVKGIVNGHYSLQMLSGMAACAGLALNTRVSGGIGLILAFALLMLVLVTKPETNTEAEPRPFPRRILRTLVSRRTLIPTGILASLMAVSGMVNTFRWGNPFTFANWDIYLGWAPWPNMSDWWLSPELTIVHQFGTFNIIRIPFNFIYYFCPVWALHTTTVEEVLSTYWAGQTIAQVEMPPSSFLLTDLFAFCFIALLAIALWKRRSRGSSSAGRWAAAVAIGLLIPCMLMLTAMWVAYRYRSEFYPEIQFLAFLGLFFTVTDERMQALVRRMRRWIGTVLLVSVAFSFLELFLIDTGQSLARPIGGMGLVKYYIQTTEDHLHKIFSVHPGTSR